MDSRYRESVREIKDTDGLVIGPVIAGCRAALESFQLGAKVMVISKAPFGKSGKTAFPVAEPAGYNVADASGM